jgi:hypothetical protein
VEGAAAAVAAVGATDEATAAGTAGTWAATAVEVEVVEAATAAEVEVEVVDWEEEVPRGAVRVAEAGARSPSPRRPPAVRHGRTLTIRQRE